MMNELKGLIEAFGKQLLSTLQLVTQEEFDVQKKVLERTRERLEALEQKHEAASNTHA